MEIKPQLEHRVHQVEEVVRPQLELAKAKLSALNEEVVGFIKAHPGPTLIGALALGFLVGRIARGGSRHGSE